MALGVGQVAEMWAVADPAKPRLSLPSPSPRGMIPCPPHPLLISPFGWLDVAFGWLCGATLGRIELEAGFPSDRSPERVDCGKALLAKRWLSGDKFAGHRGEKLGSISKWSARKVLLAPKTKGRLRCHPSEGDRSAGGIAAISTTLLCLEGDSGPEKANPFLRSTPPFDDSDRSRKHKDMGWRWGNLDKGSMSSNQSDDCNARSGRREWAPHSQGLRSQRDIRRALIEADLVDCMVALPGQLFYSTQIPVCLWFLAKNNNADAKRSFRAPASVNFSQN